MIDVTGLDFKTVAAFTFAILSYLGWVITALHWAWGVQNRINIVESNQTDMRKDFAQMRKDLKDDFNKFGDKLDRIAERSLK